MLVVMEDRTSSHQPHCRSGSKNSLSWGDGVQLTKKIFDNIIPYSDATEQTVEHVTKAFYTKNQTFLKAASKKPPLSSPIGLAGAGRGSLKPISDHNWSESCKSNNKEHRRAGSYGTLGSLPSGESSITGPYSARPLPPLGNKSSPTRISLIEHQLTSKLLSQAYQKNKGMTAEQMAYSVSNNSLDTSINSQTTYTDSRVTGYSEEDTLNFTSCAEYSFEEQSGRQVAGGAPADADKTGRIGKDRDKEQRKKKEKQFIRKYYNELEEERQILMHQWKEEFNRENGNRDGPSLGRAVQDLNDRTRTRLLDPILKFLSFAEVFISNMPLTIGAVGLSWVTQGVIWFKFIEENIDTCTTARFNSPQCVYPEFPGCFVCDQSNATYRTVVTFHYFCHIVALTCCLLFLAKCMIAWRLVADELSNPTTATPCGVVCIMMICVSGGRGVVGEFVVIMASTFHIFLSFWFLYIAVYKFHLWPDPGWFPNTVGIAYAAVKTWLYYPTAGLVIMGLCMAYLFTTFPIAIYRAYHNHKIAAPVCFISLSAPSITMYAMTIMAQSTPSDEALIESDLTFANHWRSLHRDYYLPIQHCMMVLSLIGFASSLHCLWTRWPQFRTKPFSPAHVAFIFPLLSHTNAVQAYRAGFNSFSDDPVGSPFHKVLFSYWFVCLVVGTGLNLVFTYKYIVRLPQWTKLTEAFLDDDIILIVPPTPRPPMQTIVFEMRTGDEGRGSGRGSGAHDILTQPFTSPAVLQANEAGTLMRVRRGTEDYEHYGPYIRTRNVTSLGFELTLTKDELRRERAELLDWVAKRAPRTRNRTLSIPQMFKLRGGGGGGSQEEGQEEDIYGTFHAGEAAAARGPSSGDEAPASHQRSLTWGAWAV